MRQGVSPSFLSSFSSFAAASSEIAGAAQLVGSPDKLERM